MPSYRTVPEISIRSSQGYGASITAFLGESSTTSVAIPLQSYNHIAGVATFTTGSAHGFEIDDRVRITGAGFTFAPVSLQEILVHLDMIILQVLQRSSLWWTLYWYSWKSEVKTYL